MITKWFGAGMLQNVKRVKNPMCVLYPCCVFSNLFEYIRSYIMKIFQWKKSRVIYEQITLDLYTNKP